MEEVTQEIRGKTFEIRRSIAGNTKFFDPCRVNLLLTI